MSSAMVSFNDSILSIAKRLGVQTEEKVVLLLTMALNNGVLNTGEVTKRGGRRTKI